MSRNPRAIENLQQTNTYNYNTIQYMSRNPSAFENLNRQTHTIHVEEPPRIREPKQTNTYNTCPGIHAHSRTYGRQGYNAMQCNAMQCNAMQCNAMRCDAMQCNAMQCNAMQCNTIQYNTANKHIQYMSRNPSAF